MTSAEQEIFFELLRAFIWQRKVNLKVFQTPFSWSNICRSLESHALLALVADAILNANEKLPSDCQLTQIQVMAIMQHSATIAQTHFELNAAVVDIINYLQKSLVPQTPNLVLLKGQGLATLYPIRNTRSCGDIDIFVGREQYVKICHLVDEYCGNAYHDIKIEEGDIHYKAFLGKVEFEIHHSAAYTAIPSIRDEYNRWAADWLTPEKCNTVTINGAFIKVPPFQFYIIYLFEHLLKHLRYEGVGIRQFIDWLIVLNAAMNMSSVSIQQLKSDLKHFHLLEAWQTLGGILVYQLGYPKSKFPLWNESRALHSQNKNLQFIIECGNFGEDITANREFANMSPSMHRNFLAFKYYLSRLQFEYQLLPWDTPRRFIRQLKARIKEIAKN